MFQDFDVSAAIRSLRVGENVLAIHALNQPTGSDMLIVPELVAQPMAIVTPEKLGYFAVPTPGYGNGDNVLGYVAEPMFSTPHGFYSTTQSVAITHADARRDHRLHDQRLDAAGRRQSERHQRHALHRSALDFEHDDAAGRGLQARLRAVVRRSQHLYLRQRRDQPVAAGPGAGRLRRRTASTARRSTTASIPTSSISTARRP